MGKKKKTKTPRTPAMPPRMPQNLDDFDRVIMLLGVIAKGTQLTDKKADELEDLLGVLPSKQVAAYWKTQLKKLRKEHAHPNDET